MVPIYRIGNRTPVGWLAVVGIGANDWFEAPAIVTQGHSPNRSECWSDEGSEVGYLAWHFGALGRTGKLG
jgi:hypothetical protein